MTPEVQTLIALSVVALVAVWLVRRAFRKDRSHGCGGGACGAVSPEVRKLQAGLKR